MSVSIYKKVLSVLSFVVLLSGCARENQTLPQAFFSKPSSIVITQVSGLEKPGFYHEGNQGILDYAIVRLVSDSLIDRLNEMKASDTVEKHYHNNFQSYFIKKSFATKVQKTPLKRDSLRSFSGEDAVYAPYDLRHLKTQEGVEYAFIMEPKAFGVQRPYYGFIPMGRPRGYANLNFYLVDLKSNKIVAEYSTSLTEGVQGDWDTPPDYTALIDASKRALAQAIDSAYLFFFKELPLGQK